MVSCLLADSDRIAVRVGNRRDSLAPGHVLRLAQDRHVGIGELFHNCAARSTSDEYTTGNARETIASAYAR
jgi:hypothetical protein